VIGQDVTWDTVPIALQAGADAEGEIDWNVTVAALTGGSVE
jgi:hypothetical protein